LRKVRVVYLTSQCGSSGGSPLPGLFRRNDGLLHFLRQRFRANDCTGVNQCCSSSDAPTHSRRYSSARRSDSNLAYTVIVKSVSREIAFVLDRESGKRSCLTPLSCTAMCVPIQSPMTVSFASRRTTAACIAWCVVARCTKPRSAAELRSAKATPKFRCFRQKQRPLRPEASSTKQ